MTYLLPRSTYSARILNDMIMCVPMLRKVKPNGHRRRREHERRAESVGEGWCAITKKIV
ncbi:hypothetical protein BT69DRAFT_1287245 [Atractiella rhizophila]|nr:hypothetical protein BT69DRAFT_1288613 [Atractiella rhizophila]KAH8916890.1 hypothetical protein BT69DRAFT_1287245 [Atractiella rhizophila]